MRRHISVENLASLDLGALGPRKARRFRAHLATCIVCTRVSKQLTSVSAVLASTSYPPMPESFTIRIQATIATESSQRVASAPATEAGRRDLPERGGRARHQRTGRRVPGMSGLGMRLAAAAGALVILGVGGYEIASHTGGGTAAGTSASSNGSAAAPGTGQVSLGPEVRYGQSAASKSVRTVTSDTNFTAANLGSLALASVREAQQHGAAGSVPASRAPAPSTQANTGASGATGYATPSSSQLASCLDGIAGSKRVLLVEEAKFEGKPATIIVTAQTSTQQAEVWAVGPSCTASNPDVLDHLRLSRT
jgi:hypothetical protein